MIRLERVAFGLGLCALAVLLAVPLAVLSSVSVTTPASAQGRDPRLEWSTLRTPHFEVHYHAPLEDAADKVAALSEESYRRIGTLLGHVPSMPTHVVLSDLSDSANGSAQGIPFNRIELFLTSPPDLSPLDEYRDWLRLLVAHEFVHIAHIDKVGGLPAVVNKVLGRSYLPNQIVPRWFLEGLAVYGESLVDGGGRLRSRVFDMYLRAEMMKARPLRLDQLSNIIDIWPQGAAWYLLGGHFVNYIAEAHGHDVLRRFIDIYGSQTLPFAMNRALARTGTPTFEALYPQFIADAQASARRKVEAIERAGVIEGTRITHLGQNFADPRFYDGQLYVYANPPDGPPGLHRVSLDTGKVVRTVRTLGSAAPTAPSPDGLYYSAPAPLRHIHAFGDLFRMDARGRTQRLTHGLRASQPVFDAVRQQLIFVMNDGGSRHLATLPLADMRAKPELLLRVNSGDQVYSPHLSPDGSELSVSIWREGGYRDLYTYNFEARTWHRWWRDRNIDRQPFYTPDGHYILFASERDGIPDLYARDRRDGRILRVTRVTTGAFYPIVDDKSEHLVYVGYTAAGFDIFRLPYAPETWVPVADFPAREDPPHVPVPSSEATEPESYAPLRHLWPRAYGVAYEDAGAGQEFAISMTATDPAAFTQVSARLGIPQNFPGLNVDANLRYNHLLAPTGFGVSKREVERDAIRIGSTPHTYRENRTALNLSSQLPLRQDYRNHLIRGSVGATQIEASEPLGIPLDPNIGPPRLPFFGWVGRASLGYVYTDTYRGPFDISTTDGTQATFDVLLSDPLSAAASPTVTLRYSLRHFWRMPWHRLHVLAASYSGGAALGGLAGVGTLVLGGYRTADLLEDLISGEQLLGARLRGFPAFVRAGNHLHLANLEYRLPLWRAQRGISTLPIYLARTSFLAFVDVGDVFNAYSDISPLFGTGGELLFDLLLGYVAALNVRVGVAYGIGDPLGGVQGYANFGVPF